MRRSWFSLGKSSRWKRSFIFFAGDTIFIALALYLSFLILFEGQIPQKYLARLDLYLLIALVVKLPIFYLLRLHRMSWAYVSFNELIAVFKSVSLSSIALGTLFFMLGGDQIVEGFPRSILILDYFLTLFLIGGLRSARRIYFGLFSSFPTQGRRVLIVGAGDAGEQIVRAMLQERRSQYFPVGFVDDDPAKQGVAIHSIRVIGKRAA